MVILAGGKNSRFGGPKGLIPIGGVPIISRLAMEARGAGMDEVYISTNDRETYAELGLPLIPDIHRDCGPMGGIHSVLTHIDATDILVIPCDTPGITGGELGALLACARENPDAMVIFARSPSGLHPLCAIVRRGMLPFIEKAINEKRLSVNKLFNAVEHVEVNFTDEKPFRNLNTQGDLEKLEVGSNA